MYIENGIAYAGESKPMIKVYGVRPMDDYKPAFAPLKEVETFKKVYIDYGVPVWNEGDIDIAPEYLYEN